jgi:hypothetical protein
MIRCPICTFGTANWGDLPYLADSMLKLLLVTPIAALRSLATPHWLVHQRPPRNRIAHKEASCDFLINVYLGVYPFSLLCWLI